MTRTNENGKKGGAGRRGSIVALWLFLATMSAFAQTAPPPPKPTPLDFSPPEVSRFTTPEQARQFEQNPGLEEELWEQDRKIKGEVAKHDAATKAYSAHEIAESAKTRGEIRAAKIKAQSAGYNLKAPATGNASPEKSNNAAPLATALFSAFALLAVWAWFKFIKKPAKSA
jgi:hypothetical protein